MEEKGPEARTVKTDETVETGTTVKSNRDKWRRQAAQPAATAMQSQPHEPGYYCGHAETVARGRQCPADSINHGCRRAQAAMGKTSLWTRQSTYTNPPTPVTGHPCLQTSTIKQQAADSQRTRRTRRAPRQTMMLRDTRPPVPSCIPTWIGGRCHQGVVSSAAQLRLDRAAMPRQWYG